jgi:hypothetical protein
MIRISGLAARLTSIAAAGVTASAVIGIAPPAHATTCASGGPCAVGDIGPGGGIVFIAPSTSGNSTGQFFEAAPNTWSGSAPDGVGQWCNASSASVAGLGTTIGTGSTNSVAIAAACTSTGTNDASAFIASRTIGGLTGWFLPSRDEMLALYDQRAFLTGSYATNRANADAARYLTSSQSSNFTSNAVGAYMEGSVAPGTAQDISKSFNFSLRPVRMFTATEASGSGSSGSSQANPPDVMQQVGRGPQDRCTELTIPALDWSGATGGWAPSWAEWAVPTSGGLVCTRTLYYVSSGVWAVRP